MESQKKQHKLVTKKGKIFTFRTLKSGKVSVTMDMTCARFIYKLIAKRA